MPTLQQWTTTRPSRKQFLLTSLHEHVCLCVLMAALFSECFQQKHVKLQEGKPAWQRCTLKPSCSHKLRTTHHKQLQRTLRESILNTMILKRKISHKTKDTLLQIPNQLRSIFTHFCYKDLYTQDGSMQFRTVEKHYDFVDVFCRVFRGEACDDLGGTFCESFRRMSIRPNTKSSCFHAYLTFHINNFQ